jgi:hypothetical protein
VREAVRPLLRPELPLWLTSGISAVRGEKKSPHPRGLEYGFECWGPRAGRDVSADTPEGRGYASSGTRYRGHDARVHSARTATMDVPGLRGAP